MDIVEAWSAIISQLGYSLDDPHLEDSPKRVARFMETWHTQGKPPPKVTRFLNRDKYDQPVTVSGIRFYSICAHHGLPFFGSAAISYVPKDRIGGLSKLPRVVDHFARRFQVQERLTRQVADYLWKELDPVSVAVALEAEHLCVSMRGIERPLHSAVTTAFLGEFKDESAARRELLELLACKRQ